MSCKHCFHWDRSSETFNTEIQSCCECGYVDTSMSRIDKLVRQAVEDGFYQQTKDQEAIQRVRELHKPVTSYKGIHHDEIVGCYECEETGSGREYWVEYPCPTIKALNGEQ